MRATRTFGAAMAVAAAMGALSASAAVALPSTLTLDEGTAHRSLTPGEEIRIVTENPVVIETSAERVECEDKSDFTAFFGHVTSNNEKIDTLSFETGGFMFGESCNSSGSLGSATVEPEGLPWNLSASYTGAVVVKGSPKVGVKMTFASGATCLYEKTAVKGSLSNKPIYGSQQLFAPKLVGQKLNRVGKASSKECPASATLTAEFQETVSQNNELVYDIANTVY